MRDAVPGYGIEEVAEVRFAQHHDLAAERQHRKAQHAGRVRQGCEREVDRPSLEGVAQEDDGGHRLEVRAVEHDPLGPAGCATGPGDHHHVVRRLGVPRLVRNAGEPGLELGLQANEDGELWQLVTDLIYERRE